MEETGQRLIHSRTTAAERVRLYRKRSGRGLRSIRILLHVTEIEDLVRKGYLREDHGGIRRSWRARFAYFWQRRLLTKDCRAAPQTGNAKFTPGSI
jgi:hypothetical protein